MAKAYEEFEARRKVTIGTVGLVPQEIQPGSTPVPIIPFDLEYHCRLRNPHLDVNTTPKPQQEERDPPAEGSAAIEHSASVFIETTQAAGAYLESQLFTSSLQALLSPLSSRYSSPDVADPGSFVTRNASSPPVVAGNQPLSTPGACESSLELSTFIPTPLAPRITSPTTTTPIIPITRPDAPLQLSIAPTNTKSTPSVEILTRTPALKRKRELLESETRRVRTPKIFFNAEIATSSTLSAPSNASVQPMPAPSSDLSNAQNGPSSSANAHEAPSHDSAQPVPALGSSLLVVEIAPSAARVDQEAPISVATPVRRSPVQYTRPLSPERILSAAQIVPNTSIRRQDVPISVPTSIKRSPVYGVLPPQPPTLLAASWSSAAVKHTYITPSLLELDGTLSLSKRFRPSVSTRALRPSERGCWLVETGTWDVTLQHEFWEELSSFVIDGRAGWGVTCFRGEDDMGHSTNVEQTGLVRVYCWGEVVGHVYLLLFLASKSKVKRTGAQWVDAGGTMVVTMP